MKIAEAIKKLSRSDDEIYAMAGEVLSVDKDARTCDVRPLNGDADLFDVRLQPTPNGSTGIVQLPKKGTTVLVVFLSKDACFVAMADEIEAVEIKVQKQTILYDSDGVVVSSAQSGLRDDMDALVTLMDGLLDTLIQFQLSTSVGPTIAVMPHIVQKLMTAKTDLKAVQTNYRTYLNKA